MSKMDVGGNGALSPAGLHRLRPARDHRHEPQRGRRHSGRRRQRGRTTTTSPTSRPSRRLPSRPSARRRRCRCRARWPSTSASPAATRITAASTRISRTTRWKRRTSTTSQIARGVSGGPGLDVRDVNRLEHFRDFTADVGGYLKKDKAWWYGAYRSTAVEQRYPWLLDTAATLDGRRSGPARSPTCSRRARSSSAICSTKPSRSRVSSPSARASRSRPATRCRASCSR